MLVPVPTGCNERAKTQPSKKAIATSSTSAKKMKPMGTSMSDWQGYAGT